jgi:hypothetical protein
MKNVTITLEERVAKWARMRAAELNTSVSRLVGKMLLEAMRRERAYDASRRTYLAVEARPLRGSAQRYPRREELHERAGLR